MFRGYRWQLLALMVAVALFIVTLLTRGGSDLTPSTTAPPTQAASPTISPEPSLTNAPAMTTVTSQPVNAPAQNAEDTDTVPTYTEALIGEVRRLNPVLAGLNPVDEDITSLIFEGLTRINPYGEVEPALAEDWVVSFDGLEYVVTLRQDVLWQDGIPFTAADVVYTMSILGSPDFPGPADLGQFWRTVEVEAINDYLVRFRLTQPLGSFPEALRIGILPFHALTGTSASQLATHPFNLDPVGTGPYQLENLSIVEGQIEAVSLRVAPVYRQRPEGQTGYALDRVKFKLYPTLEAVVQALADGTAQGYATRTQSERLPLLNLADTITPHTAHAPTVGLLVFNWVKEELPYFREERVRQALMVGLDRNQIIQRNLLNLAVRADSPMLRQSWAYHGGLIWPPYDISLARELLNTAGFTPQAEEGDTATSQNGPLFRFSILTVDNPALVNVAQEIATQWSLLNVEVTVDAVNLATYRQRLTSSDFDAALVELSNQGSADPDLYPFWHQSQYPEGQNYGGANDRTISEALERARRDENGMNRIVHYRNFQQQFISRGIAIPLYYPLYTYAVAPQIAGVQLGFIGKPSDRFLTIKDWRIVEG